MGEGQKTKLYSFPPTASQLLQCNTLVCPTRSQTKKPETYTEAKKVLLRGVGPGNSKKKEKNSRLVAD